MKSQLPHGLFIREDVDTVTLRVISFRWIPTDQCLMESRWLGIDPELATGVEIIADSATMIPNYEALILKISVVADLNAMRIGHVAAWRGQFWVYDRLFTEKDGIVTDKLAIRMLGNPLRIE